MGDVIKIKRRTSSPARQFEKLWGREVRQAGFTQVPNALLERQAALGLDAVDFSILAQLIAHWWEPDRYPYPSKARLAERVGLSTRQVQRRIVALERDGLIECERRRGYNTTYHLQKLVALVQKASREIVAERKQKHERDRVRTRRKNLAG